MAYAKTSKTTKQKQAIRRAAERQQRDRLFGTIRNHVVALTTEKLYDVRAWRKLGIVHPATTAVTVYETDKNKAPLIECELRKLGFVSVTVNVGNILDFQLSDAVAKYGKVDFIWADFVGWVNATKVRWGLDNLNLRNLAIGAEVWITTTNNFRTQPEIAKQLHNLQKRHNPTVRAALAKIGGCAEHAKGSDCKGNRDNAGITETGQVMMIAGLRVERKGITAYADNKIWPMSHGRYVVMGRSGKSAFKALAERFADAA